MANTLRIKRRASGAPGAPAELQNAELAFNEVDNTLYYGEGTGGSGGTATTVLAIAGDVKADVNSPAFTGTPTAPTAAPGTNTTQLATTAFVAAAVTAGSVADGDKGDITVSGSGTVWTIDPEAWADAPISDDTQAALDDKLDAALLGAANGIATLGADSKIPANQLPAIAITDTFVVASEATMLALDAEVGDVAIRTDTDETYILQAEPASTLSNWVLLLSPGTGGSVSSVDVSGGTTGLTTSGGPITSTGTITLAGTLAVAHGGTGSTTATGARTSLGLGTMAVQNANAVAITGGTIDNIDLDGGVF